MHELFSELRYKKAILLMKKKEYLLLDLHGVAVTVDQHLS
jgi:hypothetical protein